MVKVPIWEPNVSDLPGASKYPHSTGDTFGEQVGVAQQQAGAAISKGFNELGSALSGQQDEQDAIKAKVAASDHETAVNLETLRLQQTVPASEQAKIPDMVAQFANDRWQQVLPTLGKYGPMANQSVTIFHNNLYLKNQQQGVKNYYDAIEGQFKSEVQKQGFNMFADPNNLHAAAGALSAYVNETTLPPDVKRSVLRDAATHLQSQTMAGYQVRIQTAAAKGDTATAERLQKEMLTAATALPKQLSNLLGIDRLPMPAPPQVMQPQQPLPYQRQGVQPQGQPRSELPANNLKAADTALTLTPEEKNLYNTHLANLKGPGGLDQPDGKRSSLLATSVTIDDKTYMIPTVKGGKQLSTEDAIANAKQVGLDKFPAYKSPEEAKARYDKMHSFMEKDTQAYQTQKRAPGRTGALQDDTGTPAPQQVSAAMATIKRMPAEYTAPLREDLQFVLARGGHKAGGETAPDTNPALLMRMAAAGRAYQQETGREPRYGEMGRTVQLQAIYRARYEAGTGGIAARPGQSHHNTGNATDVPSGPFRDWLYAGGARRFGLHFPVRGDAPHMEVNRASPVNLERRSDLQNEDNASG